MRIGSIIISHLSKQGKARFFILCDVIFLVGLQENFEVITIGSARVHPYELLVISGVKQGRGG